jgi:hypothetical protein
MEIELTREECRRVDSVALSLSEFWHKGSKTERYIQTLSGLLAEFAAIKYLNDTLGATPRIEFNTNYQDGGDGGFDFRFINGMTWDSKSTSGETIPRAHCRTKAQIVVGSMKCGFGRYEVWGFLPASRLPDVDLCRDHFRDIRSLASIFPQSFDRDRIRHTKTNSNLESVADIVRNSVRRAALIVEDRQNDGLNI